MTGWRAAKWFPPVRLFRRNAGPVADRKAAHRSMAHRLLDRYKAGEEFTSEEVDWALRQTGDL